MAWERCQRCECDTNPTIDDYIANNGLSVGPVMACARPLLVCVGLRWPMHGNKQVKWLWGRLRPNGMAFSGANISSAETLMQTMATQIIFCVYATLDSHQSNNSTLFQWTASPFIHSLSLFYDVRHSDQTHSHSTLQPLIVYLFIAITKRETESRQLRHCRGKSLHHI